MHGRLAIRGAVATCLLLNVSGCSQSEPADAVVVREESGIEVVTSPTLLRLDNPDHQWSLELTRRFATASSDPTIPPRIWNPETIGRAADGSLIIADKGPYRFVVLRNDSVISRFGLRGSGPGEIKVENGGLAVVPMPDGNITVVELWGNARVHRYSSTGGFIEDLPLSTFAGWWSKGRTPHELTVQLATPGPTPGAPFGQHVARLDLMTGKTEFAAPLPPTVEPVPGGQPMFYPIRFWAALATGAIVTMRTDSGRVTVYGSGGRVERFIDLPLLPSPLTLEVQAEIEEVFPGWPGEAYAPYRRLVRKLVAVNDSLFALEHTWLTVPADETISNRNRVVWRLVSDAGRQRGIVSFPESFDPWISTGEHILGVRQDSLGVATIEEYKLLPPDRPNARAPRNRT